MSSSQDALFNPSEFRENGKDVILKRSDLARFASGRMVKPGSGSVSYEAGTVLGQITSAGPTQGRWQPAIDTATDGSEVAKGVLNRGLTIDSVTDMSEISIIMSGDLRADDLIYAGNVATAKSQLKAVEWVEKGVNAIHIG